MAIDFKKLSQVSDSVFSDSMKQVSVDNLEVQDKKSVLDSIEIRSKIKSDSVQPRKLKRVADSMPKDDSNSKTYSKVLILDDVQIDNIMNLPRLQRKKFLSRLSDSQRRRVLDRYVEMKSRIKDDFEDEHLGYDPDDVDPRYEMPAPRSEDPMNDPVSKLDLVNLVTLLQNSLYDPSVYNNRLLQDAMDTILGNNLEDCFILASKVIDGSFNKDSDKELLDKVQSLIDEYQIDVNLIDITNLIYDSVKGTVVKALTNAAKTALVSAATDLASDFLKKNLPVGDSIDMLEEIAAPYVSEGFPYDEVINLLKNTFWDVLWPQHQEKVRDAVIDELAESTTLDEEGNPVTDTPSRSILEELNSALTEYLSGNEKPLQQLASVDLSGNDVDFEPDESSGTDDSSDDSQDIDEDSLDDSQDNSIEDLSEDSNSESSTTLGGSLDLEEDDENIDSLDNQNSETLDIDSSEESGKDSGNITININLNGKKEKQFVESEEDIQDSVKLASALLTKDFVTVNKVLDSLKYKVPVLSKYNFRVSDCEISSVEISEITPPIEVPMSHDEFYSAYNSFEVPQVVKALYGTEKCMPVKSFEVQPNGCIVTNSEGYPQQWYPCELSDEPFEQLLNSLSPEERANRIEGSCIPLDKAVNYAAASNNLPFIDGKFYKAHASDKGWSFDTCPKCISDCGVTSGIVYPQWVDIPAAVPSKAVLIYGYPYKVVSK